MRTDYTKGKVTKTIYYAIARREIDKLPASAVLDMLRYDGARVEPNGPDGFWLFSISRDDGEDPNVKRERWRSYGIEVDLVASCTWDIRELIRSRALTLELAVRADDTGAIRVFVNGRATSPLFNSEGAAAAYRDLIRSGARQPEFSAG